MRPALRPRLNRLIARLMCWVLLFGWMAGAANACILQAPLAVTAAHAATHAVAHEHAAGGAGHHHHHDAAAGAAHDDHGHDDEAPPGQQACKSLCDSEQSAVAKTGASDAAAMLPLGAVMTGHCLVLPAALVTRVPRPDAATLPAPPPIPIAFLRLTI